MISILLASRHDGNGNMKFANLVSSLICHSNPPHNWEILVKLDDDDSDHPLRNGNWNENIKFIITPRANGYADLHKAYNDLLSIASPSSKLFWVLSDDVEIPIVGWNDKLLSISSDKPFIINTVSYFHLLTMTKKNSLEKCDTYPVWSKKWVALSGFGYTFATDGWTSMMCHELETVLGIKKEDYRFFIDLKPFRRPDEIVEPESERWNGIREKQRNEMIERSLSPQIQSLIHIKAEVLAREICQK